MTTSSTPTTLGASKAIVTTQWLAEHLGTPGLVVVDGSWHLPTAGRDGRAEYEAAHIPGAVFFDVDAVSDTTSGLPHMLPTPAVFAEAASLLGITEASTIVVYDGSGLFSAARVWWTFKVFGARDVHILDGGFPRWQAEKRPVEAGAVTPTPRAFTPSFDAGKVAGIDQVEQYLVSASVQVVDARPAERFRGEAPEPRPGVKPGHMPGSRNVPATEIVKDGRLANPDEVRAAFAKAGVDIEKPIVTSCGSGVTAALLWLALDSVGHAPQAIYDGSWTEWGASDKPIVKGPAD